MKIFRLTLVDLSRGLWVSIILSTCLCTSLWNPNVAHQRTYCIVLSIRSYLFSTHAALLTKLKISYGPSSKGRKYLKISIRLINYYLAKSSWVSLQTSVFLYTDTTCELWERNNLVLFLVVCVPNKEVSDSSKGMGEMHVEFRTWSVQKFCPPLFL